MLQQSAEANAAASAELEDRLGRFAEARDQDEFVRRRRDAEWALRVQVLEDRLVEVTALTEEATSRADANVRAQAPSAQLLGESLALAERAERSREQSTSLNPDP